MSRTDTVGSHKTAVYTDPDSFTRVIYQKTCVVAFNHEKIILNTGGWETSTTKRRMNQASVQYNLGYHVYAKNRVLHVDFNGEHWSSF